MSNQDVIIALVSLHACVKERLKLRRVCRSALESFSKCDLCDKRNYKKVMLAFTILKEHKHEIRKRVNSWKRRLHTDDEVIISF